MYPPAAPAYSNLFLSRYANIFGCTAATLSSRSNTATNGSNQPGATSTSLFKRTTYSASIISIARLYPPANPKLSSNNTRSTSGNSCSKHLQEPSVEWLSTTTTRPKSAFVFFTTEGKNSRNNFSPFQFNIIIATRFTILILDFSF